MRRVNPESLTVKQIHFLLLEKRRAVRQSRLEHFHRTGRVSSLVGETSVEADIREPSIRSSTLVRQPRTWLDIVLLVAESLAVIGLVALAISFLSTLGSFNQKVAASLQQPTLEPTPMIQAIVLPEGHTPPNGPGGARPNEAEIPEHLRPLWQSFSDLPTSVPALGQAIRIQIPAIKVDAPVVQGDSWEQLKKGVAQQIGTPNPGEIGNLVLSGHNDVYGEVFRYLDQLKPGDEVTLFTSRRKYTYIVAGTQMAKPSAVEVMAQTRDARVTLISCHPYLVDDHRIVISAILQSP